MPKSNDAKAEKSAERFFGALGGRPPPGGFPKGSEPTVPFLLCPSFFILFLLGQSGFINLMRIKSRYYTEGVFPKLQRDIEAALKSFPGFKQELFDKLYDFFHRSVEGYPGRDRQAKRC